MTVAGYASSIHYAEHVAPICEALQAPLYAPRASEWGSPLPAGWRAHGRTGAVIVASWADYRRMAPSRVPIVFVNHGAGQTYGGDPRGRGNECYSGGQGRERVALYIEPNETCAAASRAAQPDVPVAVVGASPKMDRWYRLRCAGGRGSAEEHAGSTRGPELESGSGPEPDTPGLRPTVALTWHWPCRMVPECGSAWGHYRRHLPALAAEAGRRGWRLLGHAHPRWGRRLDSAYQAAGIPIARTLDEVFARASILVADNTSALPEFASIGKPVVVLNAPQYRKEVHHGLRFWDLVPGVQCDDPDRLAASIVVALEDPPAVAAERRRVVDAVYPCRDGRASERAAAAITALVAGSASTVAL